MYIISTWFGLFDAARVVSVRHGSVCLIMTVFDLDLDEAYVQTPDVAVPYVVWLIMSRLMALDWAGRDESIKW